MSVITVVLGMFHGIWTLRQISYDESEDDHVFLVPFIIILEVMEVNDTVTSFCQVLVVSPFPFTLKSLKSESVLQQCPSEHEDTRFLSLIPESVCVSGFGKPDIPSTWQQLWSVGSWSLQCSLTGLHSLNLLLSPSGRAENQTGAIVISVQCKGTTWFFNSLLRERNKRVKWIICHMHKQKLHMGQE